MAQTTDRPALEVRCGGDGGRHCNLYANVRRAKSNELSLLPGFATRPCRGRDSNGKMAATIGR
jgi:hypothetical protein